MNECTKYDTRDTWHTSYRPTDRPTDRPNARTLARTNKRNSERANEQGKKYLLLWKCVQLTFWNSMAWFNRQQWWGSRQREGWRVFQFRNKIKNVVPAGKRTVPVTALKIDAPSFRIFNAPKNNKKKTNFYYWKELPRVQTSENEKHNLTFWAHSTIWKLFSPVLEN